MDAAFVGGGRLGRGAILAAAFVNGAVDFAALWGLGGEKKRRNQINAAARLAINNLALFETNFTSWQMQATQ